MLRRELAYDHATQRRAEPCNDAPRTQTFPLGHWKCTHLAAFIRLAWGKQTTARGALDDLPVQLQMPMPEKPPSAVSSWFTTPGWHGYMWESSCSWQVQYFYCGKVTKKQGGEKRMNISWDHFTALPFRFLIRWMLAIITLFATNKRWLNKIFTLAGIVGFATFIVLLWTSLDRPPAYARWAKHGFGTHFSSRP